MGQDASRPTYDELLDQVQCLGEETRLRREADQRLRQQNAYLSALHQTTLGLLNRLDRDELLKAILDNAARLVGTGHGFFYLIDTGETEMRMRVVKGFFTGQIDRRVKPGEGLGGRIWETGEPLVVDDYGSWAGRLPDRALDAIRTVVGIPMVRGGHVEGVIGLARLAGEGRFDQTVVDALGRFAELALIALDNSRLYGELRRELAERKQTEKNLRESEKRYRRLLDASPDPIVLYDMGGATVYVNPAFEHTFGWSKEELIGQRIDFVPDESWQETQAAIAKMLRGETIQLFDTRRQTRDGRILDVQLSSTLFKGPGGNIAGNIVILRDVSTQKAAERALQEHQEVLEARVVDRTAALKAQSQHLEEVNTALRVLLKQRDADKAELGENVRNNVKELVLPYLSQLKRSRLPDNLATLVQILETNLSHIVSPFIGVLSSRQFNLTPTEIQVASLVKAGRTNQQIAEILFVSKNTILFHRHNIRTKLGIKNTKTNLATHLLTFER